MIYQRARIHARKFRRRIVPKGYASYYLQERLKAFQDSTYLEIGVRRGETFRSLQANTKIAIDPVRTDEFLRLGSGEFFFQMTSDVFFGLHASQCLETSGISVAFIDGLHTYSQSLKDLLNTASWMHEIGSIILDDCWPRTREEASPTPHGNSWCGEVWKTAALIRETQPQWTLRTLARDRGICIVSNFHEPPREIPTRIFKDFENMDYEELARHPELVNLEICKT